eukprot:16448981-Heterocapsa_arctica.AAC.1
MQAASVHHIRGVVAEAKVPRELPNPEEAARALLGAGPAYSSEEATTVRTYDRSLLSIPAVGATPVPLTSVLPPEACAFLEDISSLLVNEQVWGERCESQRSQATYMDVKLRSSPKHYHQFISDLWDAGLLRWSDKVAARVSVFCVAKKSGKLRLVVDCRAANRCFRECPHVPMGSGAAWGELLLEESSDFFVGLSDIKDYFYECAIPPDLSEYFSLPDVSG